LLPFCYHLPAKSSNNRVGLICGRAWGAGRFRAIANRNAGGRGKGYPPVSFAECSAKSCLDCVSVPAQGQSQPVAVCRCAVEHRHQAVTELHRRRQVRNVLTLGQRASQADHWPAARVKACRTVPSDRLTAYGACAGHSGPPLRISALAFAGVYGLLLAQSTRPAAWPRQTPRLSRRTEQAAPCHSSRR
jgi:hypothetical protein